MKLGLLYKLAQIYFQLMHMYRIVLQTFDIVLNVLLDSL